MTNANDPELLAAVEKAINDPEYVESVNRPRKSVMPTDGTLIASLIDGGGSTSPPLTEGPVPMEERMRYWRAGYWTLRRMLEHIAETEGEDAATRMRSIAKDALCGKAYAERG